MSRRVGLRCISSIAGKVKKLIPSAWSYFNVVGQVWLADTAGSEGGYYFKRITGSAALFIDEPQGWGGGYFNR